MLNRKEQTRIAAIANHLMQAAKKVEQAIALYQQGNYQAALLETQRQIHICRDIRQEIDECVKTIEKKGNMHTTLLTLSQQEAILEQHTVMLENLLSEIVAAEKQTELAADIDQEAKRQEFKKKLKEGGS